MLDLNHGSALVYGRTHRPPDNASDRINIHVDRALVARNQQQKPRDYLGGSRVAEMKRPRFALNPKSDAAHAKLIVLDEVSMVGEEMARDLMSFGKPILVLGDPGQLPPIQGEGAFTKTAPDIMLTEIHRQAAESAIIRLATMAREGLPIGFGQYDSHVWKIHKMDVTPEQALRGGQVICGMNASDAIISYLKQGEAPLHISSAVSIAHATHSVQRLRTPIAYTTPMHSFDYANVVNFWQRNFKNAHQAKAIFLSAWFVTDTIHEIESYPDMPGPAKPDPDSQRGWAEGVATDRLLAALEDEVFDQDPSRSVALVRQWNRRHPAERKESREALIRMLAHCAGKYQGDAHIFRNATSVIEEYQLNTASPARKDILFEFWAHFLSFYKKRTLDTDCYDMYHRYFGTEALVPA